MAITNDGVKLFESQRLSDEEDGGGRVTGSEVIDGNVNNLFQDIIGDWKRLYLAANITAQRSRVLQSIQLERHY